MCAPLPMSSSFGSAMKASSGFCLISGKGGHNHVGQPVEYPLGCVANMFVFSFRSLYIAWHCHTNHGQDCTNFARVSPSGPSRLLACTAVSHNLDPVLVRKSCGCPMQFGDKECRWAQDVISWSRDPRSFAPVARHHPVPWGNMPSLCFWSFQ